MTMVSGCWEHMHLVWDELNTAKSNKTSIGAVWLDIANVFAFIPHQLMFFSLKHCGINPTQIVLLTSYYTGLWSRFVFTKARFGWHKHFRGIFIGFTVCIILSLAGMSVILEFQDGGHSSLSSPLFSTLVEASMDDILRMLPLLSKIQELLHFASLVLLWTSMLVKASKSKSLVLASGKIVHDKSFCISLDVNHSAIPFNADNPVKFLG